MKFSFFFSFFLANIKRTNIIFVRSIKKIQNRSDLYVCNYSNAFMSYCNDSNYFMIYKIFAEEILHINYLKLDFKKLIFFTFLLANYYQL